MQASRTKHNQASTSGRGGVGATGENGQLKTLLVALVLLALVMSSALGVVYSSYKSRKLFAELQQLDREAIHLEEEWGRLLLEQSTWASHSRVEHLAKTKLNMVVPESGDIVVVEQ